jgi:hypothetical protein
MLKTVTFSDTAAALTGISQEAPMIGTSRAVLSGNGEEFRESYWRQGLTAMKGSGPVIADIVWSRRCSTAGIHVAGAGQLAISCAEIGIARPTTHRARIRARRAEAITPPRVSNQAIGELSLGPITRAILCSDGVNFWVTLQSSAGQLAKL